MAPAPGHEMLELALALDVSQLPIAGTLADDGGTPQPFAGWLELIAAIESVLTSARGPEVPTE